MMQHRRAQKFLHRKHATVKAFDDTLKKYNGVRQKELSEFQKL